MYATLTLIEFAISCYASPTFSDELAGVMWDSYVLDKN